MSFFSSAQSHSPLHATFWLASQLVQHFLSLGGLEVNAVSGNVFGNCNGLLTARTEFTSYSMAGSHHEKAQCWVFFSFFSVGEQALPSHTHTRACCTPRATHTTACCTPRAIASLSRRDTACCTHGMLHSTGHCKPFTACCTHGMLHSTSLVLRGTCSSGGKGAE